MDPLNQYVNVQLKEGKMKGAQKAYDEAIQINIEANKEHRSIFEKYYDSILLYSASIFSFTLAVIGVIDENKVKALTTIGLFIPNIYWLYSCWTLFLITCLIIIARKRFDALYVLTFGMEHYTKAFLDKEMAEYEFVKNYPNVVTIKPKEENLKIQLSNINVLKTAYANNKKGREKYYSFITILSKVVETTAILGIFLLLIFAIQFSQSLIW
jgi:hypothetical protein